MSLSPISNIFSDESRINFTRTFGHREISSTRNLSTFTIPNDVKIPSESSSKRKRFNTELLSEKDSYDTRHEASAVSNDLDHSKGDTSKDERTIFVGNLSVQETISSIKKIFAQFGDIESVRVRSVPTAGTAIDDKGNQNLMKKVCINSGSLGTQKGSMNAYLVFKSVEAVQKALGIDNVVFNNRHIRVDTIQPRLFDPKRTIFMGALPHYADEEELREYVSKVLPNGHHDIEGVRIVRDAETCVGKGIGYMLLKDSDAVSAALTLHEV